MKTNCYLNNKISEQEKKTINKELKNRECRLRYKARQKGLRIRKENYQIDNQKFSGYLITRYGSALVLTGYNHFNNLIAIEEAERFVEEY